MEKRTRALWFTLALLTFAVIAAMFIRNLTPSRQGAAFNRYNCDVNSITFSTEISIKKNGEYLGKVTGNILKLLTDPLTMYDTDGNKLSYASDSYRVYAQDSHGIYIW